MRAGNRLLCGRPPIGLVWPRVPRNYIINRGHQTLANYVIFFLLQVLLQLPHGLFSSDVTEVFHRNYPYLREVTLERVKQRFDRCCSAKISECDNELTAKVRIEVKRCPERRRQCIESAWVSDFAKGESGA